MKPYLARTLPLIGILVLCFPSAAFAQDADSDFLSDAEELAIGSDPFDTDTDGDGILDRNELYPFKIVAGTFTYEAALADAASKGGRLVVIDSLDKLYRVKRGLLSAALPNPLPNNYDPSVTLASPLWIGAQDSGSDGRYQWADFGSTLANPINLSELGSSVFADLTPGSSTVSNVVNVGALTVGRPFVASGVPSGTTITAINSAARTLTLSNPVASILSQRISRVVVSNAGYSYTSPPVVSFSGASGVSSVTVTAGGSLYVNPPTVSFTGGTGTGATAIATVSGGVVTGVTITSRGSFTVAPTGVSFTPVGGGSGAAATVSLGTGPTTAVTLSAGRIQSITVTGDGGTFYTAAPTVTISGGNGGGALATAVLTLAANGNVSAAAVTAPGTGYTNTTTVTIAGGGGTGATAAATVVAGQVTGIAILNPGSGYTSAPVVTITGAGTGATATASIRQFAGRVSSPVPGAYVNWASDLLPGNRVNSQEGVFLSASSAFTWETAQVVTTRGYLLELRPTQPANADTDADGVTDGIETNPAVGGFTSNPLVADTDGDGLNDGQELAFGSNPTLVDTDGDGLTDLQESNYGNDPLVADVTKDTDGDGLTNQFEVDTSLTNPTSADTDADGVSDGIEINGVGGFTSNPLLPDTDGDGASDSQELNAVPPTNPRDPASKPAVIPPEDLYKFSQFKNEVPVTIPVTYTPFGNRMEFNRYGDDGSKCVLDASGVLTWIDSAGVVRLLPDSAQAIPLFVTNSECLVWSNRFVDFNSYPARPNASLTMFRAVAGRATVTSSPVTFQGKEVVETAPATTTTGALTFISTTRKDNGAETPGPINNSDDADIRFYRVTFDAGVQFVKALSIPVRPVPDFGIGVTGPGVSSIGHGSDGSIAVKIPDVQTNPKLTPAVYTDQYHWFDSQGRSVLFQTGSVIQVLFCSNTRLVYADTAGVIKEQRRSLSTGSLVGLPTAIALFTATEKVLDLTNYARVGDQKFIYTLDTDKKTVRTYLLGSTAALRSTAVLTDAITTSAVTGTVNPVDGSALVYDEDSSKLIWLRAGGAGFSYLGTNQSRALFVTNEQAVIWENATDLPGGDGNLPAAVVAHYDSSLTRTVVTTVGTNLLNTSRITPDFAYWLFTTSKKTTADTSLLTTYALGTFPILNMDSDGDGIQDYDEINPVPPRVATDPTKADTDGDGLNDGVETNTGLFVSATNTGTNPTVADTDGDGLSDKVETNTGIFVSAVNTGTNPTVADTDGDGLSDGAEVDAGTDPLEFDVLDTDGDGISDDDELNLTQTDPNTPSFGPGTGTEVIPFGNSLVSGDYAGLVFDPKSGQSFKQNLRLSSKGSFSSSLLGLVVDSSFKSSFSATGAFTGIPNPTSGLISVTMNLVKQGVNKYYIEGNFKTRTGGTLYFQLRHTLYSKSYAYLSAGKVTFEAALLTSASGPAGSAVATGSISTSGQVAFKIYLPDGSSSSYSAPIVNGDLIPLFSRSSSKARTVLIGTLKLQDLSGQSDFDGSVRLFSAVGATGSLFPSGFDQLRELTGSRYYPPATGVLPLASFSPSANNSVFNWLGGNFDGVQKVGTWATNGQMTIPATQNDRSKATFTSSSGLLSLSYTRTDVTRNLLNAPTKGYAVVVQKSKTFKGYYTSGLSAGDFVVEANTSGLNPEITSVYPLKNESVRAAATSYTITVGTAGAWAVVIPSSANWLTATVSSVAGETGPSLTTPGDGNGTVVINVAQNFTNVRREAEITIAGIKHTIKQEFY